MEIQNATDAWLHTVGKVLSTGGWRYARGLKFKETIAFQSAPIDMHMPVVSVAERKLGKRFLAGEAFWILSGRADVKYMKNIVPVMQNFSNDGETFDGAYGPMLIQQIRYLTDCLIEDNGSRQAVATMWRPNPRPSKDVPCTVSIQLMIRDGLLHCIDTMRSSDLWLGWPYDVFNFSMFSLLVLLRMKKNPGFNGIGLGSLTMQCGSQHIYEKDVESLEAIRKQHKIIPYAPLDEDEFISPQDLLDFLERRADGNVMDHHTFLKEFYQ